MSGLRAILSLLAAGVSSSVAPLAAQAGAQNPAPIRAVSADGGYAVRFSPGGGTETYYRISYQGRLVREQGTPFKWARALELLAPASHKAAGDVPALELQYENNQAIATGGFVEALGTKELKLAGLTGLGLRGTAEFGADIKFNHVQGAVGLETPPCRVPGLAGSGISNWIVIGINAERRQTVDTGGQNVNLALATFRSFVGKAIGWRKSADVRETAGKIVHDLLDLAPTRRAADSLRPVLDSIPASRRTRLQQTLLDLIPEVTNDSEWVATVEAMALGQADAITDQPTVALYGEWSGWADLASHPSNGRVRTLFTASLDYWFLPSRDDVLLRFRYELGYERAIPELRKNQLLVSVGIRL